MSDIFLYILMSLIVVFLVPTVAIFVMFIGHLFVGCWIFIIGYYFVWKLLTKEGF